MRPLPLLAASVSSLLLLTSVSCTKEEADTTAAAVEPAEAAPAAEVVEPVAVEDALAYQAMGYAMGSQLRLNIGFSDAEIDQILEGMRIAAKGGAEPENFKEAVQQAQTIYMGKMQAAQAEEQQKAAVLAGENQAKSAGFFASLSEKDGVKKTASGLYYEVIEEGTGNSPVATDRVTVNYKGTLIDGREFDATTEGNPAKFPVGGVIKGWTEALQLMPVGSKWMLYVHPDLAYGANPRPGGIIESNHLLIFEIELLEITE